MKQATVVVEMDEEMMADVGSQRSAIMLHTSYFRLLTSRHQVAYLQSANQSVW